LSPFGLQSRFPVKKKRANIGKMTVLTKNSPCTFFGSHPPSPPGFTLVILPTAATRVSNLVLEILETWINPEKVFTAKKNPP